MTAITLAEKKLNQFLPLLKIAYPNSVSNQLKIKEIASFYEATSFSDDVLVGLIDVPKNQFVYFSDNIYQLSGYTKRKLLEIGPLLLFKVIHESHHSLPFQYIKRQKIFLEQILREQIIDTKNYFCGVKILTAEGDIRRIFMKTKTILVDENNNPSLIACFIEDVTHLVKNDTYWLRLENGDHSFAYVHQKGKKEFKDLISKKERETLVLMAKHKSNIEIANELFVSTSTVESHRKNMIKRLGAASSSALIHLCKMANII